MRPVRLALDLVGTNAQAVSLVGGCSMDILATTARTATVTQTALCQTPIAVAVCQTTCVTTAIHPVLRAAALAQAAVPSATQVLFSKVSMPMLWTP